MTKQPNIQQYDRTVIAFSGGKDSLACLLLALKLGCPNIELWHHDVDGQEGSDLMDWPCTRAYCEAIAKALRLPIYFSWLEGGFEREMLRHEQRKAKTWFETPSGLKSAGGTGGKKSTRMMFPQKSGDLSVRWCSAYLKIDVASMAINNQKRFRHSKTLFISGERAEESPKRAKYATFEPHRSDARSGKLGKHVDHWRPVHGWSTAEVWGIIQEFRINPHPAYRLGWGRLSCFKCIFGSADQWASIRVIDPEGFKKIADYETAFGKTIDRKLTVGELADKGKPYPGMKPQDIEAALSRGFSEPVIIDQWKAPAGVCAELTGPY